MKAPFPILKLIHLINKPLTSIAVFLFLAASPSSVAQKVSPVALVQSDSKIIIKSDRQLNDSHIGVLTATGNVRIIYSKGGFSARARQAQYFSKEEHLVLSGEVELVHDRGDFIRSDRLIYMIREDQIVADSGPGSKVFSRFNFYSPLPLNTSEIQ